MANAFGIHWFRRDLRIAGNPALQKNWKENHGRVLGLFCFDQKFLNRDDFSANRFQFFIHTLKALKEELVAAGSDLLFLNEGPQDAFRTLFQQLKSHGLELPNLLTWNRDYEPYAIQRDHDITQLLNEWSISHTSCCDHLLIEPHQITKQGTTDQHYQVFTPFSRQWLNKFQSQDTQATIQKQHHAFDYLESLAKGKTKPIFSLTWKSFTAHKLVLKDHLQAFDQHNQKNVTIPIPKAGSLQAFKNLKKFSEKLALYQEHRDIPSCAGTSQLSIFLKNGSLTTAQIIAYLKLQPFDPKHKTSKDSFLNELIWREFYYHILYHNPQVEHEAFKPQYNALQWENNPQWLVHWKNGTTGFPIVDAAMRQLNQTGWMHNRCRMIVASFLCKDLLIDWREGEKYFMHQLLDGDLAPNNGGWQWAASTGCDAQPYFRIFNPWSQSKKFDPKGKYIRTYINELTTVDANILHHEEKIKHVYMPPIVNHKQQREKALSMYKQIR